MSFRCIRSISPIARFSYSRSISTTSPTRLAQLTRPTRFAPTSASSLTHRCNMSTSSTLPALQSPPSLPEGTSPKLHLYTQGTPNGFKPSIYLEELIETYGAEKVGYDFAALSFQEADQKKPEFLKINPNGRIPALVDDNFTDPVTNAGMAVFESASILLWLAENYDTDSKFWFEDKLLRSKALSWIFFAHGGVGPMQGESFELVPVMYARGRKAEWRWKQDWKAVNGDKGHGLLVRLHSRTQRDRQWAQPAFSLLGDPSSPVGDERNIS